MYLKYFEGLNCEWCNITANSYYIPSSKNENHVMPLFMISNPISTGMYINCVLLFVMSCMWKFFQNLILCYIFFVFFSEILESLTVGAIKRSLCTENCIFIYWSKVHGDFVRLALHDFRYIFAISWLLYM